MISIFIKNHYNCVFTQTNKYNIERVCNIVIDTAGLFDTSYAQAIELLPNKNQNSSL